MLMNVNSSHKCCASCEFWGGDRQVQPNSGGRGFQVDEFTSVKTVGYCECGRSMYASRERPANAVVCNCYRKWHALK